MPSHNEVMSELRRPRSGRIIGGVCAALAQRFGWDVSLVRVLAVVSVLIPGPQVLAYILAWAIIPGETDVVVSAAPTTPPTHAG
jgi:phage shock protein C